MSDEIEVDREVMNFQCVEAYREDAEEMPIVQILIETNRPLDGVLVMTPGEALALAGELRAAVESLDQPASL